MGLSELMAGRGRRLVLGAATLTLGVGLAAAAVPTAAQAAVPATASGHHAVTYRLRPRPHGVKPKVITGPLINHGGPVQSAPRVYIVFWGWTSDPSGEQPYLERFLSSVGGTPWLATVDQYGGGSGLNLLNGTWSDSAAIPASPSDAQIQAEAQKAASHFGTGNSANVQIVVATPTGHSTPGFGTQFCAYHGVVSADPDVTYTDLPYMTDAGSSCGEDSVNGANGTLDGVSIVEGHELAESITDPLINAWYDASGNEIGDKCAWFDLSNITTTTGTFAVQPLWSNAANGCALSTGGGTAPYQTVFQANTTSLWTAGSDGTANLGLGMAGGTTPSIANLTTGGYEAAFQANTGALWVTGADGTVNTGLGMAAGTSPSITALANGGYEVAFQANTGLLWVYGSAGTGSLGYGMAAHTSPAIAGLRNGSYEAAFQANTGSLWTVGSDNHGSWNLGMAAGTSPAIAATSNGSYEAAFQANTTSLWVAGSLGTGNLGLGMAAGTSPSIAGLSGGGYQAAFQANTGLLWVAGSAGTGSLGYGMAAHTSPAITGLSNGSYEAAFQANTTSLWTVGSDNHGAWNLGMAAGTSPGITS